MPFMTTAVITFVYNEAINLPIWRRYYAGIFGEQNLFVIDHSSTDGSTDDLGAMNRLWLAREELDEHKRCVFMASYVKALLEYFDTVIYTDCDEILVPDVGIYPDLKNYIEKNDFEYIAPTGLNLQHVISLEPPLDLTKPILAQRKFVRFSGSMCKPLVTRIPIVWDTGFHACNQPVRIAADLFMFHLKLMDYDVALKKHEQTRTMRWAASSLAANHGAHARYDTERFIRESFLDANNIATNPNHGIGSFDFSKEIERLKFETIHRGNIYYAPHFNGKVAEIPERLRDAF
jgi:hypothetical protein